MTAPARNEREHRTRTTPTNTCPTPGCGRTKPVNKAFCLPCWRTLPHDVQRQVWASYRDRDLYDHVDFLMRLGAHIADGLGRPWPAP